MRVSYGWVVVAAGAVMTCVAAGALFSLAVFLQPIARDTGWSVTGISTAMSLVLIVMGFAGFGWGIAADRIGARPVLLVAGLLVGLALVLASRATTLTEFLLIYGVLAGIAAGGFFAPLTSSAIAWVDSHRGLAAALVTAGFGVAPLTMSPLAVRLIEANGWRDAMFSIGLIAWAVLVPTACLVRRPPAEPVGVPTEAPISARPVRVALGSPHFAALAITFFFCCAAHSGPIFHMVSYATLCGVGPMAAVSIYGVEGAAGLFGRLALGLAADRWGAKPVIVGGLLLQAGTIASYTAVSDLTHFYLLATLFGTAYGGVMPLYAVLARDWFGVRILGTVLGAAGMISSVGMAFGPIAGGWLLEHFGGYAWMFVGSAVVGLGAVLVATTFPPATRPAVAA